MPYIITPGIQTTDAGTNFDTIAAADLQEAREIVTRLWNARYPQSDAWAEKFTGAGFVAESIAEIVGEDGGKVCGSHDCYVIDVRSATYVELRKLCGLEGVELYGIRDERRAQILDAFNRCADGLGHG